MVETEQFNIRLSKHLIYDLEFIAQHLKINKSEWLKVKIAELISRERAKILEQADQRYEKGYLDDNQYKELTGLFPSETLKENKNFQKRLKERIQEEGKKHAKMFMDEFLKK